MALVQIPAPQAGSLTLLSTTTLSGTSTTVSSIPQGYQHLFWVLFEITMDGPAQIRVTPNSDNQGYISYNKYNAGAGTNAVGGDFGALQITAGESLLATDAFGVWTGEFHNYSATTYRKAFSVQGAFQNTSSQVIATQGGGLWNIESAITSIRVDNNSSRTFTAGTFLLYGVR